MQQINDLRVEIESFETEIKKLKEDLQIVGGRTLELANSNDPSEIAKSFRLEAQKICDRAPVIKGTQNAIAQLNSLLVQKKAQLQEMEALELKRERLQRVQEGRSRLQGKVADVQGAAESLKKLFFELKLIANEYQEDFNHLYPPTPVRRELNTASLLNFGLLTVPQLVENDGRFLLNSQAFDVFEEEKKVLQKQRVEASRRSQQNHQDLQVQIKNQQLEKERAIEQQERAAFITQKQEQLQTLKNQRGWEMRGQVATNFHPLHDAIASLEVEIENLEKAVQT